MRGKEQIGGLTKVDGRCRDRIPGDIVSRVRSTCTMSPSDAAVATCATDTDVDDLVSLRAAMFIEFGSAPEVVARAEWRRAAEEWFTASLASPVVRIAVIRMANRAVACGVAQLRHDIPSPFNPGGRIAYVSAVMTRADSRGRGYARAVMTHLDEWAAEVGAGRLELFATHQGRPLYESMGYTVHGEPAMRRRLE